MSLKDKTICHPIRMHFWNRRWNQKENLHGAYLAYTQGDAHENPKPEKGGGEKRPGEEKTVRGGKGGQGRKNPGEEPPSKIMPARAADTRPV